MLGTYDVLSITLPVVNATTTPSVVDAISITRFYMTGGTTYATGKRAVIT